MWCLLSLECTNKYKISIRGNFGTLRKPLIPYMCVASLRGFLDDLNGVFFHKTAKNTNFSSKYCCVYSMLRYLPHCGITLTQYNTVSCAHICLKSSLMESNLLCALLIYFCTVRKNYILYMCTYIYCRLPPPFRQSPLQYLRRSLAKYGPASKEPICNVLAIHDHVHTDCTFQKADWPLALAMPRK